jgi:hypothetical protein
VSGRRAAVGGLVAAAVFASAFRCAAAPQRSGEPPPAQDAATKSVTLAIGERGEVDSGRLALVFRAVSEDSRCPKNEQCVWAGNARVVLDVSVGGAVPAAISLDTNRGEAEAEIDRYVLHLDGLAPVPVSGRAISSESYRVTISLRPR